MRVPLVLPHAANVMPTDTKVEVNQTPWWFQLWQEGKTNLSHDGLNPAHVPCWWVNNPTLPLGWEARKSRHRRIKKQRRFERLAATSQLSLW
jgi:hypothetical protein